MKYKLFFILAILSIEFVAAQNFHLLDIPVVENNIPLKNAWAGGLNAPQWSAIDLNRDGRKDLYVFDRNGHVHLAFINQDNTTGVSDFKYARHWLANFPNGQHYVLMRDYNRDGAADMFVSAFDEGLSGFKVYKGHFNENNQLDFDRYLFPEFTYDIIPFMQNGSVAGQLEVYNNADYPAIDDLDGDGDMDILTMNALGDKVLYFKNTALESGFNDEELRFELGDECWGKFGLTPFSQKFTLSSTADNCAFFQGPDDLESRVHGGTTMCTFDQDYDGAKEILYGDLIYPTIIYGDNTGNNNDSWITAQDTSYPSYNTPIDIADFPASFYIDVNNDGHKDLIACPNQPNGTPDINNVWLYEDQGAGEKVEFAFKQDDFIVNSMLDFGTGANPVFEDVNADGLLDIVVGNREEWGSVQNRSYLVLLLNTGTASEPSFEVTDRDWLGMSQYNPDARSFCPAFGDIDGDGDKDLFLGDRQGFVHFLENTAGPNEAMTFDDPEFFWMDINVGPYSTPFVFDVNQDGLPDLVVGERAGNVNFLPNIGDANNPVFHPNEGEAPNNQFFGNISTLLGGNSIGFSQPSIVDVNNELYLFTGSNAGWIFQYRINPDSLNAGAFEQMTNQLGNLREGFISRAFFANINEDNYLDAIVGNDRGGLSIFQSPITTDGLVDNKEIHPSDQFEVLIYPNPAGHQLTVQVDKNHSFFYYKIINSTGQILFSGKSLQDSQVLDLSSLNPGMFFIEIKTNEWSKTERFIKSF